VQEPLATGATTAPPRLASGSRGALDDNVTDRVVAIVNNDAITLGELQEQVAIYRYENRDRVSASDDDLYRMFLTRLIDNRLQLQEAEREKITVDDSEVEEEMRDRMKRVGAKSLPELEAMIKAEGINMVSLKTRMRETLRMSKVVRRKVALRISVTEEEVDRYVAENREKLETGLSYHARHILIVPETDSDAGWEAARIRADMIRAEVVKGGDFAELARQYSKDASGKDGGDLGTLKRGELAQDIEAQILSLEPGEISTPYRGRLGYHIFRLETKDALQGAGLERVRQQVKEILFRQKYEARLDAWLKEIKQRAIIEVRM
jgi:peptidyl-prolyl cis-trans isomerase SurA